MLKKVLNFLFGSKPKIFNSKGDVEHNLGDEKWHEWDGRYTKSLSHDWKQHSGNKPKDLRSTNI